MKKKIRMPINFLSLLSEKVSFFQTHGRCHKRKTLLSVFAVLTSFSFSNVGVASESLTAASSIHLAQSPPPRSVRRPAGRVSSGATRTDCDLENNSNLSIADNDIYYVFPQSSEQEHGGNTESTSPQVWVYVPYVLDERSLVKFEIERVDTGEFVYESGAMTIAAAGGLLGLSAPVSLETGANYAWRFKVYCNSQDIRTAAQSVSGGLRVVAPGELPLSERWYDRLNALMSAYQLNPDDATIQANWMEMIEVTGLTDFPHTSAHTIITFPTMD
jgi:hypothetical protein